jgi:hypothetical protein
MKRLLVLLALLLSHPALAFLPHGGGIVSGGGPPTPVIIQQASTTVNPGGAGFNGNNYVRQLPNAIQANDLLYVGVSYPHGTFSSITDTNGTTFGSPICTADAGVGNYTTAVWLVPAMPAGRDFVTVNLTSLTRPFQMTLVEFNNIATASPVNGTASCVANSAINAGTSVVNPGSLTPSNNDAAGGTLVYSYLAMASGTGAGNPTSYTAASGYTQVDQDTAWNSNTSFYHATQMFLQRTAAATTPSMTIAGNTSDHFNVITVPLKVASAGGSLPSTIYVRKLLDLTAAPIAPANFNWVLQAQFTGNLRIMDGSFLQGFGWSFQTPAVTDSDGNTWLSADSNKFIWYCFCAASTGNTFVTVHYSSAANTTPNTTVRMFDVLNATAFDVGAALAPTGSCSSVTSFGGAPNITPTHSNGLVIGHFAPSSYTTGVTSPAGAQYALVNYTGDADADFMNNGDGMAILYNSTTAAENWTWTLISFAGSTCFAAAAAFH